MTIFEKTERRATKMNITFSKGNGLPNTVFKLSLQKKKTYRLNESQKTFGGNFSLYQWFSRADYFQKQ